MLASLAGCFNVMIYKIAVKKGIVLLDLEIDVVGICDSPGIHGCEPVDVPFPKIREDIRAKTQNSESEIEILKQQLAWRCPVKLILKQSGSLIKESWDIEYV